MIRKCLKRLSIQSKEEYGSHIAQQNRNSDMILKDTSTILDLVQGTSKSVSQIHIAIATNADQQAAQNLRINETMTRISSQILQTAGYGERGLQLLRKGGAQINEAVVRLASVMSDLRRLIFMYVITTWLNPEFLIPAEYLNAPEKC